MMPRWVTATLTRLALVLVGVGLALGLLLLVEGALVLLGAGTGPPGYDPLAGFSPTVPLFAPAPRPDGTRIFRASPARLRARPTAAVDLDPQREFLAEKPPGLFRLFVVGDSTAAGIPYDPAHGFSGWLRRRLIDALGAERVEVVNAAVSGYGSRRVLVTLREVTTHRPDAVVVYSGHNEMAERRFYGRLHAMNPRLFGLLERAVNTRLFTLLSRKIFMPRPPTPEEVATFARDDSRYATEMFGVTTEHSAGRQHWTAADFAHRDALYRANMEEMVRVIRAAGARPVLLTLTQNFADWPPGSSLHRPGLGADDARRWQSLFAAGEQAAGGGDCARALDSWAAAEAIDGEFADLHWRMARCLRALGRLDEARARYRRASDLDRVPLGAPTSCNDTIRDIARAERTLLVDVDALIMGASGERLAGDDLFVDFLHPNLRGHQLIAAAIADTLREAGVPVPAAAWRPVEPDPPPARLYAENPGLHDQERASRMVTCVLAQRLDCMREEATALAEHPEYGVVARGVLKGLAARAGRP